MSNQTSAPDLLRDVRQTRETAGLRHVIDAEAWINSDLEVLCKVTVAPDERPDASALPGALLRALQAGGFALTAPRDSAAPDTLSPEAALHQGHAVRVSVASWRL